jgi:hypothetical protein
MDDMVKQAMAKWPNVPDCFGWLGLDNRGQWYLRDDPAQAAGAFTSGVAGAKGSVLRHEKLIEFIQRNYANDAQGHWFFQNGPQRVYVELEATPWVWRVQSDFSVQSHTGEETQYTRCLMDEQGWVYLETPLGFGLVHTQDVPIAAQAIEQGLWVVEDAVRQDLPGRYGYTKSPAAQQPPTTRK